MKVHKETALASRSALFTCLHESATEMCALALARQDPLPLLHAVRSCCNLLSMKRTALYCASALAVARQTGNEPSQEAHHVLLLALTTLQSCAALWCRHPHQAETASIGLIGIAALNRLRLFLRRKPLAPAETEETSMCAMARLAAPVLRALVSGNAHPPAAALPFLACRCPESENVQLRIRAVLPLCTPRCLSDAAGLRQAIGAGAQAILARQLTSTISQLACELDTQQAVAEAGVDRQLLYRAVMCGRKLERLAFLLDPVACTLRADVDCLLWQVVRAADHGGQPVCALRLLVQSLQALAFLLPVLLSPQPRTVPSLRPPALPNDKGWTFLERPGIWSSGAKSSLEPDVLALLQKETASQIRLLSTIEQVTQTAGYVDARLCVALYKLVLNLRTGGFYRLGMLAASLQRTLNLFLEQHRKVTQELLQATVDLLNQIANLDAGDHLREPALEQPLIFRLLYLEACTAMDPAADVLFRPARVEDSAIETSLPLYLAGTLRVITRDSASLAAAVSHRESPQQWRKLARAVQFELNVLAEGARRLKVYRVEALAAALLELCQSLLAPQDFSPGAQQLLLRGHKQLRKMLNQAAARHEVTSARPLVAEIYHWLEKPPESGTAEPGPLDATGRMLSPQVPTSSDQPSVVFQQLLNLTADCQSMHRRLTRITGRNTHVLAEAERSRLIEALSVQNRQLLLLERKLKATLGNC